MPGWKHSDSIQTVAVLGLGTMGPGIAQAFAVAGCDVHCYDALPAARDSLINRMRSNLDEFVRAELLTSAEANGALSRTHVAATEELALRDAEFVTEAIREDLAAKQELFARIERLVGPDTILSSNSSTFPISQTAARMTTPERAIVTHWFNPPHIIPTVEIVPGPKTRDDVMQTTVALMKRLGKLAIPLSQELPGFLVNRVQIAVMREVWDLLDRGVASAEDIDAAIRGSMGFRLAAIGPLQVHDFGGLDIQAAVFQNLAPEIRSSTELPTVVRKIVDGGNYGFKTGRGFFEYPPEQAEQIRAERDRRFLELLKLLHTNHAP